MPDPSTIQKLSKVLGVPVAFLFAEDDELANLILLWTKLSATQKRMIIKRLESATSEGTRGDADSVED